MRNTEIFSNFLIHFASNPVELYRLRNYTSDISKFVGLLFSHVAAFDFGGNSMNAFDNVNHIFKSILNIVFKVFLVGIKVHMLFFYTNIKKPSFSFLFHLI